MPTPHRIASHRKRRHAGIKMRAFSSSLLLLLFAVSVESTLVVVMGPRRVHRAAGLGGAMFPVDGGGFGSFGGLDSFGSFDRLDTVPGWAVRREEDLRESMQFDQDMQQLALMMRSVMRRSAHWFGDEQLTPQVASGMSMSRPVEYRAAAQRVPPCPPSNGVLRLPSSLRAASPAPAHAEVHRTTTTTTTTAASAPTSAAATHHTAVIALGAAVAAACVALLVAAALRRRRRLRAFADELEADSDATSLYTPLLV